MKAAAGVQSGWARVRSWVRNWMGRSALEREMEAELADHVARLTEDLVAAGYAPEEARRRARVAMGTVLTHKEGMRAAVGLRWWDELGADVRYGARLLRKSPGFTAMAVVSLALAIGANTTLFSVTRQLLFERLHVPRADELRLLAWNVKGEAPMHSMWGDFQSWDDQKGMTSTVFSYPAYEQLRAHNRVLRDLFAYKEDSMNATLRGVAQRVNADMVSGNFFSELETPAQVGRVITDADDAAAAPVAMLSDGVWRRSFGASPDVLGQTIRVNQMTLTVVGVAPRGFTGAKTVLESPDLYLPIRLQPQIDPKPRSVLLNDGEFWWVNVMARRRKDVDERTAAAAMNVALQAAVRATLTVKPSEHMPQMDLENGSRGLHWSDAQFKKPMTVLMGLTGFVMLLACANIANLQLARGSQRRREMSVRLAVGAGRSRILRQLLTESLMVAGMGGVCGLGLGYAARNWLPKLLTPAWEGNQLNISFDWGVFAFTAGVTLLTGLLSGIAPAWAAAHAEVNATLKETAQTVTRGKGRSGKALIAFQIGLSTLLVVGAGLFLRTVVKLDRIDPGFDPNHLLLFEISPPPNRYSAGKDVQVHQELERRLAAVPGVESVAPSWVPLLAGSMSNSDFLVEGDPHPEEHKRPVDMNAVGTGYFGTMGIPVVAGRGFGAQDTQSSPKVGIINAALAKARFAGVNPVGKHFRMGDGPDDKWVEIVGIAGDARLDRLREEPPPQFYVPYAQMKEVGGLTYQVRTRMAAAELTPALRRVVQSIDPDLPLVDVRTQREQIQSVMYMERAFAALTAGFGVLALALACVGIYGVMAYAVARRTNEIGIRMALGAKPEQVRRMILRESTWVTAAGVAAGLGAALALARLVKSMLYGISAYDPLSLAGAVALLAAVGVAASWIPAARAAGVQPMEALRHE